MRFLLLAPLVPLAFAIYFAVRRFYPNADPEEIYVSLFASVVGAIPMFLVIGGLCRFLANREIISVPTELTLSLMAWTSSILTVAGLQIRDALEAKRERGDC